MSDRIPRPSLSTVGHLLRRSAHLVGLVVLLVVVAAFAVFAVPQLVGAEHSYVVLSGSMQPTMEAGDVIIVDDVDMDAIERGDIVSFRDESGSVTTHRVVDIVHDGTTRLRTKGDNNEEPDQGLIQESALVGRVMTVGETPLVIPYVGLAVEAARTDLGIYAMLFVPLTLLLLNEIYTRLGTRSEDPLTDGGNQRLDRHIITNGGGDHPALGHALAEGVTDLAAIGAGETRGAAAEHTAGATNNTDPRDLTLTPLVLLLVVPFSGWLILTARSIPAVMLLAGSTVALLLVAYGRISLYRASGQKASPGTLTRLDVTLATATLAVLVPISAWTALRAGSVPTTMVASGGGIALLLLVFVRIRLWWTARQRATGEEVTPA